MLLKTLAGYSTHIADRQGFTLENEGIIIYWKELVAVGVPS